MRRFWLVAAVLLAVLVTFASAQLPKVLLIDDDYGMSGNGTPLDQYFETSLNHLGFTYTLWRVNDSSGTRPNLSALSAYDLVIWDQPSFYSWQNYPVIEQDTADYGAYLAQGGKVWLHAPQFGYLYLNNGWAASSWLHVGPYDWGNIYIGIDSIIGYPGDPVGDGLAMNTEVAAMFPDDGEISERIKPVNGAAGSLMGPWADVNWVSETDTFYCAVYFDSAATGQRLYYQSTPFQSIASAQDRDTLMYRAMKWFGWDVMNISDAAVTGIRKPSGAAKTFSSEPVMVDVKSNTPANLNNAWVYAVIESLPGYPVYQDSVLVGSIPGLTTVTAVLPNWNTGDIDTMQITAWVEVAGDANAANDTLRKSIAVLPVVYLTDFESGYGRWTGDWRITGEYANSGDNCFTDRPYQNYPVNSDLCSILDTTFDMSGYTGISLSFSHRHWLENGYDFGYVMASPDGGVTWDSLGNYTGCGAADTMWHSAAIDLAAYLTSTAFKFGFRLGSDPLLNLKGWFIDDLVLTGSTSKTTMDVSNDRTQPVFVNALSRISPNPSRGRCDIAFQVGRDGSRVSLKVYNLAGQLVRTVFDGVANAGAHQLRFNGAKMASGVYFVRLTINGFAATKRLTVLK